MSVEVTKLPSGLTVITDTMPHLETAALGVWAGVGGRDEKPNEHGISHLLEHMAFKGTTRRSSREIVEEIEAVGGDLNAGTSTETTAYYARVMKADVPLALDVLSDILANPSFVPDELEREKGVIVQEIGAAQDTPDDVVFEHLNELCYPDQPMGRSLLGTAKTLKTFNREMLRGYLSTHYRGPDMVVAAAGAVDHDELVARAEAALRSLGSRTSPSPEAARYTGGETLTKKSLEQTHVVVAFAGYGIGAEDHDAAQVFATAVGGGMSSPLFQEVREKRGLAYAINAFHWTFADAGLFGVYAGCAAKDAGTLMAATLETLAEGALRLDAGAVERAKAQFKVATLSVLEQPGARAQQLARQLFAHGRPLALEETIARIERIDAAAARRAGAAMLATPPTVAAIGRVGKVWPAEKVARRLAAA